MEYWVYEIGDDGSLLTNKVKPFSRWHKLRAEFRDGRVIADYASDRLEGHGYVIEGGGTSYQGGIPTRPITGSSMKWLPSVIDPVHFVLMLISDHEKLRH